MNKKTKIYELLEMINNLQRPMPKKINCCGYEYEWDSDFQDYLRIDHEKRMTFSFLENHDDNLYCFLNDEVEILDDENTEIEELHIINGAVDGKWENGSSYNYTLSAPQTVIIKKVNELVRKINKLKKEEK